MILWPHFFVFLRAPSIRSKIIIKIIVMVLKPQSGVKKLFALWTVSNMIRNAFNNQSVVDNRINIFIHYGGVISFHQRTLIYKPVDCVGREARAL